MRSLTAMSADWFWETDTGHRVRWLSGGQPMLRLLGEELAAGRRVWEIAGVRADPQALKAHLNLLELEGGEVAFWDNRVPAGTIYLSAGWARVIDGAPANRSIPHGELIAYIHPDDRPAFVEGSLDALKGIVPSFEQELRVRAANQDWRWVHVVGRVAARDADGRVTRVLGIAANIDRRKRAEQRLSEAEERYLRLSELSPTAFS